MASHLNHMFENVFEKFESLTNKPEQFLKPASDQSLSFKNVTKELYNAIYQANQLTDLQSKALPKLLIDGFDEEQIWQQIELQNKVAISHLENTSSRIDVKGLHLGIDTEENFENGEDSFHNPSSVGHNDDEEMDVDDEEAALNLDDDESEDLDGEDSDEYVDFEKPTGKSKPNKSKENKNSLKDERGDEESEDLDDEDSDEYIDIESPSKKQKSQKRVTFQIDEFTEKSNDLEDAESEDLDGDDSDEYSDGEGTDKAKSKRLDSKKNAKSSRKGFRTEVDDQFFQLSKLEKFLRLEDLKEERSWDENKKGDESSDEDEIDLFEDIPSTDSDSEEESEQPTSTKKSSKELMYSDFFDVPGSGDESGDDTKDLANDDFDDDDFNEEDVQSEDENMEENINPSESQNDENLEKNSKNKTPFQLQQEKIREQIALFEKGLLEPAPWHLTGEVDAMKRPSEGLLELQTDFDVNARPVVIEDKPLCEKLEDMLKNTIKNKAYSDGERQYKTNNEIIAQKKEIIIEQNKSSKSLAQEYEDMYLKQKHNPGEEENPKHIAIKKLRDSLFPELHALFSHIPKPAVPDIKIVSNLPAISVEEVAPTSVSDVTLLAPEEIKKRSGLVKGVTERESTDKKRERRKKKALQKIKAKKREQESEGKPASGKLNKKEKLEAIKKLKQHRNTKIAKVDGNKIKSSKDFFNKLQETVTTNTKQVPPKKKNK
ncbi:hypothetical protein JTE90_015172 [Oedothorax gibbosus]|uniref:U3 small nucleolar ribonucleoprotein protein MPP10 n=1 Tax=Oedothorax gibbosus TaxID=931172 RepID=A0AAV6V7G2_9ARAC|nr:hypothetical protein JTE90_015172 [Oedothorax gibbosus]